MKGQLGLFASPRVLVLTAVTYFPGKLSPAVSAANGVLLRIDYEGHSMWTLKLLAGTASDGVCNQVTRIEIAFQHKQPAACILPTYHSQSLSQSCVIAG